MLKEQPEPDAHTVAVLDSSMHYRELGVGKPVVFLHGNPTSSYLWRQVMPHVAARGRCIAPDLIGMGASGKPDIGYRLRDHAAYLDAFLDALGLGHVTLVLHDWGVVLGLHLLARQPGRVRAVAFMEGHLHPIERWSDLGPDSEAMFRALRSPETGPELVLEQNFFVETVLPGGTLRPLTDEEMAAYRTPFPDPASRRPILRWVREIPIENDPPDVAEVVRDNARALIASAVPKLLLYAQPGAVIGAAEVAWCRAHLSRLTTVDLGPGLHFLPEDHPHEIGRAIARWLG